MYICFIFLYIVLFYFHEDWQLFCEWNERNPFVNAPENSARSFWFCDRCDALSAANRWSLKFPAGPMGYLSFGRILHTQHDVYQLKIFLSHHEMNCICQKLTKLIDRFVRLFLNRKNTPCNVFCFKSRCFISSSISSIIFFLSYYFSTFFVIVFLQIRTELHHYTCLIILS